MDAADSALIEGAKTDPEAFARLTDTYAPRAYRWCRALTANEEDVKDIVQEAFIRLYRSLPQLSDIGKFPGWFRRIVANAAYDWFRKYRTPYEMQSIETVFAQQGELPDQIVEQRDLRNSITAALERLSSVNRTAFTLFHERGLKVSEIARLLGTSETAVKNRLSRARAQLRAELAPLKAGPDRYRRYRIVTICGSHRQGGMSRRVADAVRASLLAASPASQVETIELASISIGACTSCLGCAATGRCVLNDGFDQLLESLLAADAMVIISPYYAPIPSRLAALLERLMAVSNMPVVEGNNPARGYPLQRRWCAVLHFGADRHQGYMASVIRESMVSMGLGLIMSEPAVAFEADILEHAAALGPLIIDTLRTTPDSDTIDNWFSYWNDENLRVLEQGWRAEIDRARRDG